MKRISSLFLSACLACGIAAPANASDFSITGYTMMRAQMSNNLSNFTEGADDWNHFNVNQRIAVLFDWVASDRLSARLDVRVPQNGSWGDNFDFNTGNYFNLYDASFTYLVPKVDVEFSIGQMLFSLPGYMGTSSNPVYQDEQTGIALSRTFGDNLAVKFNFIRMENAYLNTFGAVEMNALGNVKASKDVYTLEVPVTTDIFDITPWGAIGYLSAGREIDSEYIVNKVIGTTQYAPVGSEFESKIAYFSGVTSKIKPASNLTFGVDLLVSGSTMKDGQDTKGLSSQTATSTQNASDADAALTALSINDTDVTKITEVTVTNGLKETITYTYEGGVVTNTTTVHTVAATTDQDTSGGQALYTVTYTAENPMTYDIKYNQGYLADAYVSYDLPFMTIGLNGWYATCDKINLADKTVEYGSILSLNGSWSNGQSAYFANTGLLNNAGVSTPAGTLGAGLTLSAVPTDKIALNANAMYLMGTHEYINDSGDEESLGSINFLTTNDSLIEVGASASYTIYDNFKVNVAGNYLIPNYDGLDTDNGFVLGLGIDYIF